MNACVFSFGSSGFIRKHYGGAGASAAQLVATLVRVDGIHSVTGSVFGDESYLDSLRGAIRAAQGVTDRPSLIIVKTVIAYGSPNKHNTAEAHGSPLGAEEVKLTKQNLGWPWEEPFYVPDEALQHARQVILRGEEQQGKWRDLMLSYEREFPKEGAEFRLFLSGGLPQQHSQRRPCPHVSSFNEAKFLVAIRNGLKLSLSGETVHRIARNEIIGFAWL